MLLLIDENVPRSVIDFLRERGHEVHHVLEVALPSTKDPIVAAIGDDMHAVIVTWNHKGFKRLAARIPEDNVLRYRHLGRINFRCRESYGRRRIEEHIEAIEFHYDQAQKRRDKRLLIEITETSFNVIA